MKNLQQRVVRFIFLKHLFDQPKNNSHNNVLKNLKVQKRSKWITEKVQRHQQLLAISITKVQNKLNYYLLNLS